jgi:hypothetical protein
MLYTSNRSKDCIKMEIRNEQKNSNNDADRRNDAVKAFDGTREDSRIKKAWVTGLNTRERASSFL